MNILLTGSKGMLAKDVKLLKPDNVSLIETDVEELDITNFVDVKNFCEKYNPDLILNCAAYTAVDKAEEDVETAYAVNETGPKNLAEISELLKIPFVHISTDYVFFGDGSHPLSENDPCAPKGIYGKSKRAGELAIENAGGNWLTIRTSWLYGNGPNFPDTMLKLASERDKLTIVNDQKGSPTYSFDLAEAIWKLIEKEANGYVHFTNAGECTWFDFAVETISEAKKLGIISKEKNIEFVPVSSEEFKRPAPRPAYSVMSTKKYAEITGAPPRSWQEGLHAFLKKKCNPNL